MYNNTQENLERYIREQYAITMENLEYAEQKDNENKIYLYNGMLDAYQDILNTFCNQ